MPELCANPRFPECKHPLGDHVQGPSVSDRRAMCISPDCDCTEFVAPADTVSVTVSVPKPPEGYGAWEETPERDLTKIPAPSRVIVLTARRKPAALVAVMLTREDRAALARLPVNDAWKDEWNRLIQACRDAEVEEFTALAMSGNEPPVCGMDTYTAPFFRMIPCQQPAGHAGAHRGRSPDAIC